MIFFETEAEKEERRKKKQNEKIIRDEMIRDIRTLFEQEKKEDKVIVGIIIILSIKVMVMKNGDITV